MSNKKILMRKQKLILIMSIVVFLIPVGTSVFLGYSLVSTFVVDAYFSNIEENVAYENRIIDDYNESFMLVGSKTKEKHFYNRYMMDNMVISYYEIEDFLSKNENQTEIIESLYFYNTVTGQVHTSDGTIRDDRFFSNVISKKFTNGLTFSDITELVVVEGYDYNSEDPYLLYVLPIERDYGNDTNISFLLGQLDYELLSNIFGSLDTDNYTKFILSYNSKAFFSTDSEIHNAIISGNLVDIEESTSFLTYEERLLDVEKRGGLSIDVIINEAVVKRQTLGIVFLQSLSLGIVTIFSLILLIYNLKKNFIPLRSLLDKVKYSVDNQEIKDEYKLIDFVFDELIQDKVVLEETNNMLNREKLLYHLLRNNKGYYRPLFFQECKELGINLTAEAFLCIVIYQIDTSEVGYEEEIRLLIKNLEEPVDLYIVRLTEAQSIWLVCGGVKSTNAMLDAFKLGRKGEFDSKSIGIGSIVEEVGRINDSFNIAQTNAMFAYENELSLVCDVPSEETPKRINYPSMDLEVLEAAISQSDYDKVVFAINSLKEIVEDSNDFFVATSVYMACLNIIEDSRELDEQEGAFDQFSLKSIFDNIPSSVKDIENKLSMLSYVFSNNGPQDTGKHYGRSYKRIENVINYIEEHYMDTYFSVKYMSAYMETTPSNLSQYFKKCTGRNLSEYIDSLRIQYTKNRLSQTDVNIKDIVGELGYSNVSSFINKFKKATGQTPGEYRRMINRKWEHKKM